jgi:hypothetical protein
MRFIESHPNFKAYQHPRFQMAAVPPEALSGITGLVLRGARANELSLKSLCHDLAERIPTEPTSNWGEAYLLNDFKDFLWQLSKELPKFLDFLGKFARENLTPEEHEELNQILGKAAFGYELTTDQHGVPKWECRDDLALRTASIEATAVVVPDVFEGTIQHLAQAADNLKRSMQSDRALKDAVRDCLSAMESLLKTLTQKGDIKDAIEELRAQKKWGPDEIVKDGLSTWDRLHQIYPDLRHGQSQSSTITDAEALYWIDRITSYVRYMSRRRK